MNYKSWPSVKEWVLGLELGWPMLDSGGQAIWYKVEGRGSLLTVTVGRIVTRGQAAMIGFDSQRVDPRSSGGLLVSLPALHSYGSGSLWFLPNRVVIANRFVGAGPSYPPLMAAGGTKIHETAERGVGREEYARRLRECMMGAV